MDECILTYMGKVNDWRVQRMIAVAMMKHGAGEKVSPLEDVPLAFDDELESRFEYLCEACGIRWKKGISEICQHTGETDGIFPFRK